MRKLETLSIKEFRKLHKCKLCLYHNKMKSCFATFSCPLEVKDSEHLIKRSCPLDDDQTCPYKNEVGTCFGFCMKRILHGKNDTSR